MSQQKTSESKSPAATVRRLVERTIQRNINGVTYFVSSDPVVGQTPKDVIHKRGTLNLFHYHPMAEEVYRTPVLIVAPTSNRSYAMDMMPGVSFVEFLLKAGYDVFMMDWDPPGAEEADLSLVDYGQTFIQESLDIVRRETGEEDVSLIGYCMGGVLATIYLASTPNAGVRNFACFTTPVDFTQMGMFTRTMDKKHFDVDRLVDNIGNIPPSFVLQGFSLTEPAGRTFSQVELWRKMWDSDFVDTFRKYDRWATDMLPLAGEYFRDTVKELFWKNGLLSDKMMLGGRPVRLSNIDMPFFHAQAEHDSLIPRAASAPLIERISSKDKVELVLKGGHVSLVCGANAVRRMWPALDEWLSERSV